MNPVRIEVQSERAPYPVLVGTDLVSRAAAIFESEGLDQPPVVVSCPPVWRLHGDRLTALVAGAPAALIGDGERAKTLGTVARLYDVFVQRHLDRSGIVAAFGGGVVGDVAGFAAATYLRGVRLVQMPTTLLAQVDAAIGGKVGVNLPAGKNLAGAFHPPRLVLCDPALLTTLPRREFRSGLYEVVKYGVIASRGLFDRVAASLSAIFSHDMTVVAPLVAECCRIKAEIVGRDEREAGMRRTLNFGHTVGHALEAVTKYRRFRHGEAVAYGMLAAARISSMRGLLSSDEHQALQDVVRHMGPLPLVTDLQVSDALDAIAHDKKIVDGRLHFVLAAGLGSTATATDVTTAELTEAMTAVGLRN